MKRIYWLWIIISLLVLNMPACSFSTNLNFDSDALRGLSNSVRGSGEVISEDRRVSNFDKVDKVGRGNLVIEQGDEEALIIEAEDNLIEYIETRVNDHTLMISIRPGVDLDPTEEIHYYLTVKSLEALSVSGLGNVNIPALEADRFSTDINSFGGLIIGDLKTNSLSVDINSFGGVEIEKLNADNLSVDINSMGGVKIEKLNADNLSVDINSTGSLVIHGGIVSKQDVAISSTGEYKAGKLASEESDIRLSSLGSATVRVSDYLRVEISGDGSVHYYGDPIVDANVSGSGKVEPLGK